MAKGVEDILGAKVSEKKKNKGVDKLRKEMDANKDRIKPETTYDVDQDYKDDSSDKTKKSLKRAKKTMAKGIVNQKINIKVSEDIKKDLEVFKMMNGIKFDYEAIARLLDSWAVSIEPDQRMLYDTMRKNNRRNSDNA
jgi:hypothetical protein